MSDIPSNSSTDSDYFLSTQYRNDFDMIVKSLLLISKKIESVVTELRMLRVAQTTNLTHADPHLATQMFDQDRRDH